MHLTPSSTKFKLWGYWISAVVATYWPTLPQEWRASAVKKNSFKGRLREGKRAMYTRTDFCACGTVWNYGSAQHLISSLYWSSSFSRKASHRCYLCIGIRIHWRISRYIDSDGLIYRTAWISENCWQGTSPSGCKKQTSHGIRKKGRFIVYL